MVLAQNAPVVLLDEPTTYLDISHQVELMDLMCELAAEGKSGEQIAADLEVSAATLYNWRRQYGGMDRDAAKELKELREQNSRLKRLLADAELEKDALREVAKGKF